MHNALIILLILFSIICLFEVVHTLKEIWKGGKK